MVAGKLPNFFLVGAARAGTSSLHAYLNQHPRIFTCTPEEPCYFAREGVAALDPAARRLRRARANRAGPGPVPHPVPGRGPSQGRRRRLHDLPVRRAGGARLREHVPDAGICAILRQPVDRAYSHYLYFRFRG
jgi:hypothetical protein